jgi:hypothetical protein
MAEEIEETTPVVVGAGAIQQLGTADVEAQIAAALRHPRDLDRFINNVPKHCTFSKDAARSMTYTLERSEKDPVTGEKKKKQIVGPSVRFAEVSAVNYGNLRVGARVIDIDKTHVTGQGLAWDLENNFANCRERKGRITGKYGRYNEDMIVVASNAAASTAYREAILKTIPQYLWRPLWEQVTSWLVDTQAKFVAERDRALEFFTKRVPLKLVLEKLGKKSIDDLTEDDVLAMASWFSYCKENKVSVPDFFAEKKDEEEPSGERTTTNMAEAIKHNTSGLGTAKKTEQVLGADPATDPAKVVVAQVDKGTGQVEKVQPIDETTRRAAEALGGTVETTAATAEPKQAELLGPPKGRSR